MQQTAVHNSPTLFFFIETMKRKHRVVEEGTRTESAYANEDIHYKTINEKWS